MADLDGLKKRVELIDLRLKTAHSARERESAALMDMWDQIRDRFQDQSAEIIRLRGQIADMEDARDDLLKMVHSLLGAVEGGLEKMSDETVPRIKTMAGQLLSDSGHAPTPAPAPQAPQSYAESQPAPQPAPAPESRQEPDYESGHESARPEPQGEQNFHDDLLSAIERTIENADEEDFIDDISGSSAPQFNEPGLGEPVSPGIRDLVGRIENAVGQDFLDSPSVASEPEQPADDLTRDLREIEALRGELRGLRQRISGGSL